MKVLCLIVDENTDFPGVHKLSAINSEEIGDESGCKTGEVPVRAASGRFSGFGLSGKPVGIQAVKLQLCGPSIPVGNRKTPSARSMGTLVYFTYLVLNV